jgi:pyruvate dehydrogenase E2 component (dihydrolipoamide acetyltransferase)
MASRGPPRMAVRPLAAAGAPASSLLNEVLHTLDAAAAASGRAVAPAAKPAQQPPAAAPAAPAPAAPAAAPVSADEREALMQAQRRRMAELDRECHASLGVAQ